LTKKKIDCVGVITNYHPMMRWITVHNNLYCHSSWVYITAIYHLWNIFHDRGQTN